MKKIIIIGLMLLAGLVAKSQTPHFVYTYDNNGNRIKREFIPFRIVPVRTDSTANTTDSANVATTNQAAQQQYEAMLGEQKITVFPNPTKGELRIDITNFAVGSKGLVFVTDMQERVIYKNENINSSNILNLSLVTKGNYILKISLNNISKEWVIIKE